RELAERGTVRRSEMDELIKARQGWVSHVARIRVSDATGAVRFAPNGPPSQLSYADAEIFHQLRSGAQVGLAISPLIRSPLTGEIGRASCRERVCVSVTGGAVKQ